MTTSYSEHQTTAAGLFSPFTVKSLALRNRFVMAPMTREMSPGGVPGDDVAAYYRRRAAGEAALIITEGTYIPDPAAGPQTDVPRFYGEEALAGWRKVVEAVHEEGAAIFPQLWHTGVTRGEHSKLNPEAATVSPSGIGQGGVAVGRALLGPDLDQVVAYWVQAALDAQRVGFDGVELHGAHGYLLDQFLWDQTNIRSDSYGGSTLARTKFPARVVKEVRAAVGADFPISYRFSQWKGWDYNARIASSPIELEQVLAPLAHAGVDVFHASARRHYAAEFPEISGADGTLGLAGWAKKITGLPVITVGSVGLASAFVGSGGGKAETAPIDAVSRQFENGEFDLVAVARGMLADPEWVRKLREGRSAEWNVFDRERDVGKHEMLY